jgi:hypothetical protein
VVSTSPALKFDATLDQVARALSDEPLESLSQNARLLVDGKYCFVELYYRPDEDLIMVGRLSAFPREFTEEEAKALAVKLAEILIDSVGIFQNRHPIIA